MKFESKCYNKSTGAFETIKSIEIDQNKLTGECWLVQFQGLEACKTCDLLNTEDCGGQAILKSKQNAKGYKITKTRGIK